MTALVHYYHSKFPSVTSVKAHLLDEFSDMLPKDLSFSVGFYEGSFKRLLLKAEDLEIMYKLNKKDICLWCDGIAEEGSSSTSASGPSTKKPKEGMSRREQQEVNIDDTFVQLKEKHGSDYSVPLLRLWARVIINGHHDSFDDPPDLPQFKSKKASGSDKSLSPCKVADMRGKYIEQLQQIKSLSNDGVLDQGEYEEQKSIILATLRKLK